MRAYSEKNHDYSKSTQENRIISVSDQSGISLRNFDGE